MNRCDSLLAALRNHYADAYRVLVEIDGWGWRARCPCNPSRGFTMVILDRGDHAEPEILCRHGCDPKAIRGELGCPTPAEAEQLDRLAVRPDEPWTRQRWISTADAAWRAEA
jgi:hypothetical protein